MGVKLGATFYKEDGSTRKSDYEVTTIAISHADGESPTVRQLTTEAIARTKLLLA